MSGLLRSSFAEQAKGSGSRCCKRQQSVVASGGDDGGCASGGVDESESSAEPATALPLRGVANGSMPNASTSLGTPA